MNGFDDWLTTKQAVALAKEYGKEYTQDYMSMIARDGDLPGCRKVGSIWFLPKAAFVAWVQEDRKPGPKPE